MKPWSRHHPCCVGCGTTERPHKSRGRCQRCFDAHRYATDCRRRLMVQSAACERYDRLRGQVAEERLVREALRISSMPPEKVNEAARLLRRVN